MLRLFLLLLFCSFKGFSDTQHKVYRPFGEAIHQETPVITAEFKGQCLQQSQGIKREDAFRCLVEDKVYDPCFVNPFGSQKQAICPQSPWTAASVQINLSEPVNYDKQRHLDLSRTYPWGIELSTGEHCLALDKGGIFDKLPIRYQCNDQSVLAGYLQRCKTQWSMLQRRLDGSVQTVQIARAWF